MSNTTVSNTSCPNGHVDNDDFSDEETLQFVRSDFLMHAAGMLAAPALPNLDPPKLTKPALVLAAESLVSAEQKPIPAEERLTFASPDLNDGMLAHLSEESQREYIQEFTEANTEAIRQAVTGMGGGAAVHESGRTPSGILRLALRERIAASEKDSARTDAGDADESLGALAAASFTAVGHDELGLGPVQLHEPIANHVEQPEIEAVAAPQSELPVSQVSGAYAAVKAPAKPAPGGRLRSWFNSYGVVAATVSGVVLAVEAVALVAFYAAAPMTAAPNAPADYIPAPTQQAAEAKPSPVALAPTTTTPVPVFAPLDHIVDPQPEGTELSEEAAKTEPQAVAIVESPAPVARSGQAQPAAKAHWRLRANSAPKRKSDGPMFPSGI